MNPAAEPLILLVDDDAGLRLMLRTTLESAGFRVEEAGNCAAGLTAWERLQPDLLLLDVLMPDGDGYEVCRRVRNSTAGRNLPIVMVTGLDDTDSINRAFESGATDFITKPIHWAMVGHRLRYILRASQALTELKRSEARIDYLANRDAITGLANRNLLGDRLGVALAHNKRLHGRLAVLLIDLDRFKTINDSIGHGFGDKLLGIIAERIAACVRDEDTVSRLGGDEFAVLLPSIHGMSDVINLAERILARVAEACDIDGQLLRVSASIGISLFPDDGDSGDALLKNADAAMYLAKESGRNNYQFYTAELNTRALERLTLESRLRQAIEGGELELYYQPQISAASGTLSGVEALIRWRSPELGLVAPMRFIPLAEETGLILPIGEWTIRRTCRQIKDWQAAGLPAIRVAVNISAVQFQQRNFTKLLRQLLLEADIGGSNLELELTESMVMRDLDSVIATLHELKALGLNLAIDDFGTGYSSLNYLRRMPIDVLKIDQSFVRAMHIDPASLAIVEAIIALAKALELECIAEGVETEAELALLQNLRCEMVQGYYYARPMPAEEFQAWYLGRFGTG
ncbi:MAG: EAL domain-containing protein [Gammaproteobacteria bacterium]|nr:EAL domain-containing protein [Gammaproteobacteria bacterium]